MYIESLNIWSFKWCQGVNENPYKPSCFLDFASGSFSRLIVHSCLRVSPLLQKFIMVSWQSSRWTARFLILLCPFENTANRFCRVRELRRLEFAVNTEPDTVLLFVRLSRRLKSPNTARIFFLLCLRNHLVTLVLSAVRIPSRELALVFGVARSAVRLLPVVLSPSPLLLPLLSDLLFKDSVVLRLKLNQLFSYS